MRAGANGNAVARDVDSKLGAAGRDAGKSLANALGVETTLVYRGQKILVEISEIDQRGKLSLSPVDESADGGDAADASASTDAGA